MKKLVLICVVAVSTMIMYGQNSPNVNAPKGNPYSPSNSDCVTTLPFYSNFSQNIDVNNWYPYEENAWELEDGIYWATINNNPLLSKCVFLEPGSYRFTLSYFSESSNGVSFGINVSPGFAITYGEAGTDPYTWEYANILIDDNSEADAQSGIIRDDNTLKENHYFLLKITEPGEYQLAIKAFYQLDPSWGFMKLGFQQTSLYSTSNFDRSTSGISEEKKKGNSLTIFPNPTSSILNIKTGNNNILPEVKIYSPLGVLLINTKGNKIDVSSLAPGFYFAKVNQQTFKLVKQ